MAGAEAIPLSKADTAGIDELVARWRGAWLSQDWDAATEMCTDDVVVLSPAEETVTKAALRPWMEAYSTVQSIDFWIDHSEGAGHLAVLRGRGRLELVSDGEVIVATGRFCDVLRKDDGGKWLFACISWVPDPS